ncbi:hypothetical protein F5888DRAFT_1663163 [Russula emetica]|nr:hypothetical protein F5888DRAFT_1663163 [Russula emetica]
MADATQEYMDLGKLEKDVESRRRQVQSPAFNSLPSAIRDAFQASLANATATCERKKVSLNKALNKLSETDFWPSVPAQNVGDMEAKLKEAKTMLGGLADNVSQLYKRIESLYERRAGRSSAGPSEGTTAASASGDGDTTHTKKRRRLSVSGGDTAAADTTSPDMREDVESIRDTIREVEDRLQEMENDLTQHSRHIIEQLEAKMDEKIEEIARNTDISALVGDQQLGPQTAETIKTFHESFAQADREIAELSQEVADLIPQLDALQRENNLSKQEEAAEKELLEQLVKADHDNAEAIARLQEEANTLRSALTAHTKRALPATPAMPLSAPFMEAIKGSIITQVQEQILPIVAQTRTEMERIAKTRDTELYEKLRDKLDQSLKMSALISTWIENNPDDARQALAAVTAGAQASGAGSSDSVVT